MKMQCPHCGVDGSADRSLHGQKVRCPKCSNIFLIPALLAQQLTGQETTETTRQDQRPAGAITATAETAQEKELPAAAVDSAVLDIARDHAAVVDAAAAENLTVGIDTSAEVSEQRQGEPLSSIEGPEQGPPVTPDMILAGSSANLPVTAAVERSAGKQEQPGKPAIVDFTPSDEFTVGGVLRQAWVLVNGVKAAIWIAILVMFGVLFSVAAAAVFILTPAAAAAGSTVAIWVDILIVLFGTILSMSFLAGLINIGLRRVMGHRFSWKLIFSGYAHLSTVVRAGFLMTILITSGFFLLVVPGIYLAVGYSLSFSLIFAKDLGPWEAMELSRKIIHKQWFTVFGIYLTMFLIYLLSIMPAGLGAIWTIPMFFTLPAVLYRALCCSESEK